MLLRIMRRTLGGKHGANVCDDGDDIHANNGGGGLDPVDEWNLNCS